MKIEESDPLLYEIDALDLMQALLNACAEDVLPEIGERAAFLKIAGQRQLVLAGTLPDLVSPRVVQDLHQQSRPEERRLLPQMMPTVLAEG